MVVVSLAASTAMCISSLLFVAPIRLHCSPSSSSRSVSFCTCICLIWFFHVCFWVHCIACCVLSNCNYLPYHNKINFNLKCSNLCELKHETHTHTRTRSAFRGIYTLEYIFIWQNSVKCIRHQTEGGKYKRFVTKCKHSCCILEMKMHFKQKYTHCIMQMMIQCCFGILPKGIWKNIFNLKSRQFIWYEASVHYTLRDHFESTMVLTMVMVIAYLETSENEDRSGMGGKSAKG